jgi:lipoate-protein ligase A
MYLLISDSVDPHFNLATEEYLLKNSSQNIIFLYRNKSCVVVGKHQNAMAEVNYRFVYENKIPVHRRISGGGTVFHDEGNINFTFLQNGEEGNLVNFKAFITPVAEFLKQLDIPAEIGSRNDILVNGLKVSGNAEHIFRKRTLHHGTLLYSSQLSDLHHTLHVEAGKYTDRAVKSVRSKVTNIKNSLKNEMDTHQFFQTLADYLLNYYNASPFFLTEEASAEIQKAADTKYTDWSWNYGYSPNYSFKNSFIGNNLTLNIELEIEKGIIKQAHITGSIHEARLVELNESLLDLEHSFEALANNKVIISLAPSEKLELIWSFF